MKFSIQLGAVALGAALAFPPNAALADFCEDLWFTRNAVMHRAGYCFASPLGKAVFGNKGCRGKSVALSAERKSTVAKIQSLEKKERCKVDTRAVSLNLPDLSIRRRLVDLPVRDEFESGCIGWRSARAPLYDGYGAGAEVIGWVEPGDAVILSHINVGDWAYVTTHAEGSAGLKAGGWARGADFNEKNCESLAG